MEFTTVIGKTGQITLPSKIRQIINATPGDKVVFYVDNNNRITIKKQKTTNEIFSELDQIRTQLPSSTQRHIHENAGKTITDFRSEWLKSEVNKQALKEEYGC